MRKLEGGWEAGGRLIRNFKSRKAMSMRDVGIQGGSINGDKKELCSRVGGGRASR